ncbi:hypothetical protein [Legionella pneumophila]
MEWTRNTTWHQGAVLSDSKLLKLNVKKDVGTLAVAISHDCDIANDNIIIEPSVEFIAGMITENIDGAYSYGKNARKLHLTCQQNDKEIIIELLATNKFTVPKEKLISQHPDNSFSIDRQGRKILQKWLSARYKRQALPNNLVDRLKPVFDFIEANCKKQLSSILGIWIDYQPSEELEPDNPYELWLNIVYVTNEPNADKNANDLVNKIEEKFSKLMSKSEKLGSVILSSCKAYSESEFTLEDLRNTVEYRFDYLSYRTTPEGPTLD